MEHIKVFEAFSGYGSQSMALQRLKEHFPQFTFQVVGISEIEESAIQAYNSTHESVPNFGDITQINWDEVPNFNLFTYSFPCTDISTIGKCEGMKEDSNTRSSLLWECEKAIRAKLPKYLLLENVKALTFKKYSEDFNRWKEILESLGYKNYTKVLNSKDYGVPQSRERTFMVSILGDEEFNFPTPIPLEKSLKDVLDDTIPSRCWINPKEDGKFSRKRINEMLESGEIDPNTLEWVDLYNRLTFPICSPTITTRVYGSGNHLISVDGKIRKPTEKESLRLMGVSDSDIDKMLSLNLYHTKYHTMAGNSIVVDVMFHIFKNLFIKN